MSNFIGFNLIYWSPICGKYFLDCSFLEKCGKIWKNGRFSGRLRPDWGNTARAATVGLGSKGLSFFGGFLTRPLELFVRNAKGNPRVFRLHRNNYFDYPLVKSQDLAHLHLVALPHQALWESP